MNVAEYIMENASEETIAEFIGIHEEDISECTDEYIIEKIEEKIENISEEEELDIFLTWLG